MPITPFLDGEWFDPESKRVMGLAFEMARAALQLEGKAGPETTILAKTIIELAKSGVSDPNELCECALERFHGLAPTRDSSISTKTPPITRAPPHST